MLWFVNLQILLLALKQDS